MSVSSCGGYAGGIPVSPCGSPWTAPRRTRSRRGSRDRWRRLRLNWTSLPKRSPDDNPAETIFSDIQQNILDNSDDPDERTTRGRISRHLQARNRRSDRFVRIGYLGNIHKS